MVVEIIKIIVNLFLFLTNLKKLLILKDIITIFIQVSKFVTVDLIREEIEEKYNDQIIKLDKEVKFYPIKLNY